ncbi:MAG: RusA family crossover junction endodeoxyribonuclease [FCB group bacterium]|nr:RusA family crossover junction endodeoxyribonuclease [FCB group bacterium]
MATEPRNEAGQPTDLTGLKQWRIVVPGNPIPQKRYAPTKRGGKRATYDPSSESKKTFRFLCADRRNDHWPNEPMEGPVMVDLRFYFERPKNHFVNKNRNNRLRDDAPTYHQVTPDYDNLIKFVCDAINGLYWKDDRQIAGGPTWKAWSENPRTEIIITALENK